MSIATGLKNNERGYIVVLAAGFLVSIVTLAALVIDVGHWRSVSNKAQRAADAAATAAVAELHEVEVDTGDRTAAENAARLVAEELARDNGFDNADPGVTVTTTFSTDAFGVDHAVVNVQRTDLELFLAQVVIDEKDISAEAEAVISSCQATCGQVIAVPPPFLGTVDTSTGGDGWRPEIAGPYVFNLYHGKSEALFCVDRRTGAACAPGGDADFYAVEPYVDFPGTNANPPGSTYDTMFFFLVQWEDSTGLGCWDGDLHDNCVGFETTFELAPYKDTPETRMAGPVTVGDRIWAWGDDNHVYCYDVSDAGVCPGYPKASLHSGVYDLELDKDELGFAGGTKGGGGSAMDLYETDDGRLFFSLEHEDPIKATRLQCWDTNTDAACAGFSPTAYTEEGRPFLFLHFDAAANIDGICARGGQRANGDGHECFGLDGVSLGSPLTFDFGGDYGQQDVSATRDDGHRVTYFPNRGDSAAHCWDWTLQAVCAIAASNWLDTQDYGYNIDGPCLFGLGHAGAVFTFDINTGQKPCKATGIGKTTLTPCSCADGTTSRWTELRLTLTSDMSNYDSFLVEVTYTDGTPIATVDFAVDGVQAIDLSFLNGESPPPDSVKVSITTDPKDGLTDAEISALVDQGVTTVPGILPSLVR